MRKTQFIIGNYYHIYNRGVDKRDIFADKQDIERFLTSIGLFLGKQAIGSIRNFGDIAGAKHMVNDRPLPTPKYEGRVN